MHVNTTYLMHKTSIRFLQIVIVVIALVTVAILVRFPLTEGRATKLDLISIYTDPFILYGYAASAAFFIGLYKAYRLLGNIGSNQVFSPGSVRLLKSIKYCASILGISIVAAGVFIILFHPKGEDIAGFIALCILTTAVCAIIATAAAVFERILQNALELKSENDLTI